MAAIYMWPKGDQLILTTTLYPVVVQDSMAVTVTVDGGRMDLLPASDFTGTFTAQDGTYIQTRWFLTDGPYDSDFKGTFAAQNGTYIQTRWFLTDGPYDSDFKGTFDFVSASLINKVVPGDTPDEKLQLDMVLSNTSTMDLI